MNEYGSWVEVSKAERQREYILCHRKTTHLLHGVLNGGPCEEETIAAAEGEQDLPSHAGAALDGLGLVQDHVLPLDPVEILDILHHLNMGRERVCVRECV